MQIKMWDKVSITTTKRINWVSAPDGIIPTPHGIWTVVGILGSDLLASKNGCMCRVPLQDIQLLTEQSDGQERERGQEAASGV